MNNGLNYQGKFIDFLLNYCMMFLLFISLFVMLELANIVMMKQLTKVYFDFPLLESIWTLIPTMILVMIAIPSLDLLYKMENSKKSMLTVKVTGNQWYWNYDIFNLLNFDSYMESKSLWSPRILEVDNHLILPNTTLQLIVSSNDVIHSFSIPSLGIKIDANPGKLNSNVVDLKMCGLYYGQCSEICGANHTFMPIVLEVTNNMMFLEYLKTEMKKL